MMSVVIMVFMIYIMEHKRRGIFFGKPVPLKAVDSVGQTLRKYHGYYFSWAIVYTFWYHPVEITSGHLAGFAYMFLLLLLCGRVGPRICPQFSRVVNFSDVEGPSSC